MAKGKNVHTIQVQLKTDGSRVVGIAAVGQPMVFLNAELIAEAAKVLAALAVIQPEQKD